MRAAIAGMVLVMGAVNFAWAESRVPQSEAEISLSFAPVVREAAPAVVNIYASRLVAERVSHFAGDPFFGDFFRDYGRVVPRVQNSLGSGVIVDPEGVVVSNHHVVGEATEIRVVLGDRREFAAEVILADEASDLAVLRLEGASDLPTISLRDSDSVEVGDLVLAIGNPFGLGQTVSRGIVPALARSGLGGDGRRGYFIQTDAAINPGNSGGALVDTTGRLVGINTAIISRSGGSQGVGFAIPADLVAQVVAQAQAGETRFRRPWAGVAAQAVDAELAEAFGISPPAGVALTELHPQSPFGDAGLRPGDVILEIDASPVNTPQELHFRMAAGGIGGEAELRYLREGTAEEVAIARAPAPETPPRDRMEISGNVALRGLKAETVNPAVITENALPVTAWGVHVRAVRDRAARVGLRAGDLIQAVNGRRVESTGELAEALRMRTRLWEIEYERDGQRGALRFQF